MGIQENYKKEKRTLEVKHCKILSDAIILELRKLKEATFTFSPISTGEHTDHINYITNSGGYEIWNSEDCDKPAYHGIYWVQDETRDAEMLSNLLFKLTKHNKNQEG